LELAQNSPLSERVARRTESQEPLDVIRLGWHLFHLDDWPPGLPWMALAGMGCFVEQSPIR